MSKKIDERTGVTQYYIPINGKYQETSEALHKLYYKMDRRERYLQERSAEHELSFEALEEVFYPVEMKMVNKQPTLEDLVMNNFLVEKMLEVITGLSKKDKWIIQQIFFDGKSVVELSEETGQTRTTLQSRKIRALDKIKKRMIENDYI